jgi:para-nitrobenzyl esterase
MRKYKLLAGVLFISLFLLSCTKASHKLINQIVETKNGKVEGAINEGGTVMTFKGIPYAAPPIGDLRWKEPQSPVPWEGVRDATEFCTSCMQNRLFSHLPNGPWTEEFMVQDSVSEDCLFLNIWTPATSAAEKLPVLFYIHGGALTEGSGSIEVYDGEELAKKGIIVITINYRLGPFGFLAHSELTAESPHHASGNYGYLDQVLALKWVQENIAAFGGDPSRVTIAGQSAGAGSVNALITSPLARGLFHGAITESGTTYSNGPMGVKSLGEGEKQGAEFTRLKGAASIADLRAMSAEEILARDPETAQLRFGRVLDGYFQTEDPMKIFAEGKQNDTPFLSGMNADETRYTGETGDEFRELYPSKTEEEMASALKLAGQEQSRLNTYLWMEYRSRTSETNAYEYFFDRAIPWPEYPQFGAFHTAEVPYVFNNIKMLTSHPVMEKTDTLVADQISSFWVNFVKTGDPNGPGLPVWEHFNENKHEVMRLGKEMGMIPIAANEERYNFLKSQLLGD